MLDPRTVERDVQHCVLLVDDTDAIRNICVRALEGAQLRVLSTNNADAALILLNDHADIRLVVSDIQMPGTSGRELAECVHMRWPWIPVVLMSGDPDELQVRDICIGRLPNFIRKPFKVDTLVTIVLSWLAEVSRVSAER